MTDTEKLMDNLIRNAMRPQIEVEMDHYAPAQYRYFATFGGYDLDCEYGQGRTPLDAIVDLLDKEDG